MTHYYFLDRIAGRDANIRAADADRERIADHLRESHAEGRLDLVEFQERLERCYAARTLGELDDLVRDLPRQAESSDRGGFRPFGPWRSRLTPLVAILLALVVASAATGHHHIFWLWIPLVFLFWRMSWWRRRRWSAPARRGADLSLR